MEYGTDAIVQELARQQASEPAAGVATNGPPRNGAATQGAMPQNGNGNRASEKQVEYMRQLAKQISGMGVRRLDTLAQQMYHKPLAELTSFNASGVIDCLKGIQAGEIDLQAALGDGATSVAD